MRNMGGLLDVGLVLHVGKVGGGGFLRITPLPLLPLPPPVMNRIIATLSPRPVTAVKLTYNTYGKRCARLQFLRGRCRWPAFWSDEDWYAWCLLVTDPCGHFLSPLLCGPVVAAMAIVLLGEVFNATLGYVHIFVCACSILRAAVLYIAFSFYFCFC